MKPHHLLVGLLVVVHVLAAAALASLGYSTKVIWPESLAVAMLGTALGQLAVAAGWLAWGRRFLAIRGALLLVVVLVWLFPVASSMGLGDQRRAWWGGILLVQALSTTACLVAVRLAGANVALEGEPATAVSRIKPWQFSLGSVLTLTTMLAMLLGVGRHLDFPRDEFLSAISFCLGTATAAAASVYLAFWLRPLWLALSLPPFLCGGVGCLLWILVLPYEAFLGMGVLFGAVISLSVGVLRVGGYQLTTKQGARPST